MQAPERVESASLLQVASKPLQRQHERPRKLRDCHLIWKVPGALQQVTCDAKRNERLLVAMRGRAVVLDLQTVERLLKPADRCQEAFAGFSHQECVDRQSRAYLVKCGYS